MINYAYSKWSCEPASPPKIAWDRQYHNTLQRENEKEMTNGRRLIQEYIWRAIDDALKRPSAGEHRLSAINVIMDASFLGLYKYAFDSGGRRLQDELRKLIAEIKRDPRKSRDYRQIFNGRV